MVLTNNLAWRLVARGIRNFILVVKNLIPGRSFRTNLTIALIFIFFSAVICRNFYKQGYYSGMLDAAPPIIIPISQNAYRIYLSSTQINPADLPDAFNMYVKKKPAMHIRFKHFNPIQYQKKEIIK